jgi:hypothetical protein
MYFNLFLEKRAGLAVANAAGPYIAAAFAAAAFQCEQDDGIRSRECRLKL